MLRIVFRVEAGTTCRLGELPGAMGVAEMLLELGPVFVGGSLVVTLCTIMVELLGVGDKLKGNAGDYFVRNVVVACLGVGLPVLDLSFQIHKGGSTHPRLCHILYVDFHHFGIDCAVSIAKMGEEVERGEVGIPKLGMIEIHGVVIVDGAQKLVLERGACALVFA